MTSICQQFTKNTQLINNNSQQLKSNELDQNTFNLQNNQNIEQNIEKQKDYELELLLRAHQRIRQLQDQNVKCQLSLSQSNKIIQDLNQKLRQKNKSCELLKRLNEQLIQNLMAAQNQIKKLNRQGFQKTLILEEKTLHQQNDHQNQCLQQANGQEKRQYNQTFNSENKKLLKISESTPNLQQLSICNQQKQFIKRSKQQFNRLQQSIQNAQKSMKDSFSFTRKTFHNDDFTGSIYNSKYVSRKKSQSIKRSSSSFVKFSRQQLQKNQNLFLNRSPLIKKNMISESNNYKSNQPTICYKQQNQNNKNQIPKGLFKINLLNNAKSVNQLLMMQKKITQQGSKLKLNGQKKENSIHLTQCRKAQALQTNTYGLKYRNLYF